MIGKIKGIVESLPGDCVIIDVNGLGYIVNCSTSLLASMHLGEFISLFTQMIVKEDEISLYGFQTESDKNYFNILKTVQGVGAKVALNILSHLSINDIYMSVFAQDVSAFRQVSGIGPKLAERIVNELKSSKQFGALAEFIPTQTKQVCSDAMPSNEHADAIAALVALGYNRKDAFVAVNEIIATNENASVEEMIKISLKKFSGN